MGQDIHMFIVQNNRLIKSNFYEGRCSTWFANLRNEGTLDDYEFLPIVFGWGNFMPQEIAKRYSRERGYFDHYHIRVGYFKEWFNKYHPDIQAGWATTYEAWAIENKGYCPDYLPRVLTEEMIKEDMYFVEYPYLMDQSHWLYDYLIKNKIDDNAFICYCF